MESFITWYTRLNKPSWTPATSTIGTIWTILYPIILVTHGWVITKAIQKELSWLIALPFVLNILVNAAFSPIQFGIRNNWLTLVDALLILITIIWGMLAIWPHMKWVALANIPYLLWVTTATILQFQIAWMNR